MKVHTLDIDSSVRDVTLYPNANSYVVNLKTPIYNVSEFKLVSARIPTTQLLICASNNTFTLDDGGTTYEISLPNGNYTITSLKTELQNQLNLTGSDYTVTFGPNHAFVITASTNTANQRILKFRTGTNGYTSESSRETTPHQIIGFGSDDYGFTNTITGGFVNTNGPNSLVLKITANSDELNQDIYSTSPFYTGHILSSGSEFINCNGLDDTVIHKFHSGPQKSIESVKIDFYYMSHGRLIPYDFRNQDHILKFQLVGSKDKLENAAKIPIEVPEEKEPLISIPELKNVYPWEWQVATIIIIGTILILFTKSKPSSA